MRWFFSLPASIFYCLGTLAMHEALGSPGGIHGTPAVLAEFLLPGSIALWVLSDSRRHGHPLHYDAGSFLYFAWPVLAPIYLFLTRGFRAFSTIGWFLLLNVAAAFFGSIPYIFYVIRR